MDSAPESMEYTPINGWVPDENLPCYGLPGVLAPTGYFDPIGFSRNGITLNEIKRNREAEIMHGRVAMMACLGYIVGESFGGPFGLVGPANDQLQQVPLPAFALLATAIASAELRRAQIGWAGMCSQELINHRTIFETFDFYSKVYNGENP